MNTLKIVCDENISFAKEAFSNLGELILLPGREIKNKDLIDSDILIVRSVTNVNEALLSETNVKFVGTATIGTDHLDKDYLTSRKIKFASAPGCNSFAVSEWVITSVLKLITNHNLNPKKAAVIGYGNIGTKVAKLFKAIGLEVKIVDPPKAEKESRNDFYNIDDVLNSDIITFHVPMNKSGKNSTYHLMNEERLSKLNENTILLNSSRGAVVDNSALTKILSSKNIYTALDVWENEPNINLDLLEKVNIATPHIAGYSLEGKVNGTKMIYDELCHSLKTNSKWEPQLEELESSFISVKGTDNFNILNEAVQKMYPINEDDKELRNNSEKFDLLRKNYNVRREFNNYRISTNAITEGAAKILKSFRVTLIS